jgi:hypothetical protein
MVVAAALALTAQAQATRPPGADRVDRRMAHCLVQAGARSARGLPVTGVDVYGPNDIEPWVMFPHPNNKAGWARVSWSVFGVRIDGVLYLGMALETSLNLSVRETRAADRCGDWALVGS